MQTSFSITIQLFSKLLLNAVDIWKCIGTTITKVSEEKEVFWGPIFFEFLKWCGAYEFMILKSILGLNICQFS